MQWSLGVRVTGRPRLAHLVSMKSEVATFSVSLELKRFGADRVQPKSIHAGLPSRP